MIAFLYFQTTTNKCYRKETPSYRREEKKKIAHRACLLACLTKEKEIERERPRETKRMTVMATTTEERKAAPIHIFFLPNSVMQHVRFKQFAYVCLALILFICINNTIFFLLILFGCCCCCSCSCCCCRIRRFCCCCCCCCHC